MFPLNYALAVALLTAAPDAPETPGTDGLATVRPTLQALSISWELLDARECRYVLARPEEMDTDLMMLRRRYQELADAPPLQDCLRFPDRGLVNELLSFNRAHRQDLDSRQAPTDGRELHEVQMETDRLYQVWDTVRDARCDYYYVTVRRQALKRLREAVGPQDFYAGTLPPHVPTQRSTRIDGRQTDAR
jgi:hypothetical protein